MSERIKIVVIGKFKYELLQKDFEHLQQVAAETSISGAYEIE